MIHMLIWGFAGGMIGWAALNYTELNEDRGLAISIVAGAIGGLLGGKLLAPIFGGVAAAPGGFICHNAPAQPPRRRAHDRS